MSLFWAVCYPFVAFASGSISSSCIALVIFNPKEAGRESEEESLEKNTAVGTKEATPQNPTEVTTSTKDLPIPPSEQLRTPSLSLKRNNNLKFCVVFLLIAQKIV